MVRETSASLDSTSPPISPDIKKNAEQRAFLPIASNSLNTSQTKQLPEDQAPTPARSENENKTANQIDDAQRAKQKDALIAADGGIKLDVENGHRVLKVFDSKDVLIYQLPPKGVLQLIESQENSPKPQVQTSA
ncbi:MAG: hypothetical protein B7Y41_08990 [Hydrogenophilales bacterium 28-61-23]|nr:MAG: hypothetical protein B7Y41_08990 [Hydrogenophilales bacterium 28-61-23]